MIEPVEDLPTGAPVNISRRSLAYGDLATQALDLPVPAPDIFLADVVQRTGLAADKITLHSTLLGGFFGRHFKYTAASPYPQAAALARRQQAVYKDGVPVARNFDGYQVLRPDRMARVSTRIVESGEKMGGIGEPGLPAVPPAVANAVSRLTGKRVRAMPLAQKV